MSTELRHCPVRTADVIPRTNTAAQTIKNAAHETENRPDRPIFKGNRRRREKPGAEFAEKAEGKEREHHDHDASQGISYQRPHTFKGNFVP